MEQNARGTKMIRYINAGELLEDLKHVYCLSCKKVDTFYCWNTCDVSDIINYVLSYEPADVAPVVHAHWDEFSDYTGTHYAECSRCGLFWWIEEGTAEENEMYYCPKCGAKMDEVVG